MTAGATFLAVLLSCSWQASAANAKVREFFMYRGTKDIATSPYIQENVDLADLPGALKYIHTEVLSEHTQTAERTERKYGINTITRWRVLVNNPGAIVDMNKPPMVYADFGPFVTFDYGQATNNLPRIEQFGDFVGAQQQYTPAWAFDDPYYWFSLSGFCPSLPYKCTNGWPEAGCDSSPPVHTSMCPRDDPCPSKGTRDEPRSTDFPNGTVRADRSCSSSQGKLIGGGLCGDHKGISKDVSLEEPTGNPSCVYSYDPDEISEIVLDDIVGIKEQDCSGGKSSEGPGKCTDWAHFRSSCTDPKYKKQFDPNMSPPKLVNSKYCVEYDIHPACESDCASPECLQVPEDEREVGLDFWKGRCQARANMKRAERIAAAFGVDGAKVAHNLLARPTPEYENRICDRQKDHGTWACAANFNSGGPFCTREWGGVCTPCYIEGTQEVFSNVDIPICPLDIIKTPDYKDKGTIASCKSRSASGKCCLYFDECDMKMADAKTNVATLPLDEDSMRLIAASQETDLVLDFIKRLAMEWGQVASGDVDEKTKELREIAYWSWGKAPMKGPHLAFVKEQIQSVWNYAGPTTVTTTSGAADVPDPDVPVPPPPGGNESGGGAWIWVVVLLIIAGAAGFFLYSKNQPQRRGSRQFSQELSGGINA